jgi:hypothetical protein
MHHTQLLMTSNRCDLGRQLTGNTLPWTQWVPVCLPDRDADRFQGFEWVAGAALFVESTASSESMEKADLVELLPTRTDF